MRRQPLLTIVLIAGVTLLSATTGSGSHGQTSVVTSRPREGSFVPNEILIGLKPDVIEALTRSGTSPSHTGIASVDRLNQKYAVQDVSPLFTELDLTNPTAARLGLAGVLKLTVPSGADIFAMMSEYRQDPAIAYAEPNLIYSVVDLPNDTDFGKQWPLHNIGQTGGTPDADIDAPEAWDIEKGKAEVLIAIVDTGVDYNHPELAGGRVRTDIDRDFVNDDADAMDDHGHGTYCAGIAAANTNNSTGIAGICQGCQILPVKVLNSEGSGSSEAVAQGIQYAAQAGARVISMSLGYPSNCGCSRTVALTINYAYELGSLMIAASGNDSDKTRLSYPASSPRVMSVGASDDRDQEADFSNISQALDIMAPGVDVYSLDLDGAYRTASGTSAAAPHVSGAAGLVWSAHPTLTNAQVWWILYQSADDFPGPTTAFQGSSPLASSAMLQPADGLYVFYLPIVSKSRTTYGRLNAYRALGFSSGSQADAPEDSCSSEPSCPPECAAQIVLSGDTHEPDHLSLLRAFRDKVLAQSAIGRAWIGLYQQHRFQTALILVSDRQFRTQTGLALDLWMPLFQTLTYPDDVVGEQAILTSAQAEALEAVIDGLSDRGSSVLRSDLREVEETLQVRRFVGWDIRDAWRELNSRP